MEDWMFGIPTIEDQNRDLLRHLEPGSMHIGEFNKLNSYGFAAFNSLLQKGLIELTGPARTLVTLTVRGLAILDQMEATTMPVFFFRP